MNKTPSDEFFESLEPLVRDGSVELLQDESPFIELIEKNFPFVGSQIAWSKVPGAVTKQVDAQSFVKECIEFLEEQLKDAEISPSTNVVVLGDGAMDQAIATKVETLEAIMKDVLELPQHTYLIALNGEWCMTFTMEGYADFGRSPKEALE